MPSPRRSMKHRRPHGAGHVADRALSGSRDASSSLRVNWLVRRSSVVIELHSPPGEYSSSRSSNMNSRMRDPDTA